MVRISPKHVSKSYFYWEFVLCLEKFVLVLLATTFDQDMQIVQLVFGMFVLFFFLAI